MKCRHRVASPNLSGEHARWAANMRTAVQMRAKASQSMDFGVTDKFEQGDEVINMESMNHAERLYQAFKKMAI